MTGYPIREKREIWEQIKERGNMKGEGGRNFEAWC